MALFRGKLTKGYRQQHLPSWNPIITTTTSLPIFLVCGIMFVLIGIPLLVVSSNIKEKLIEYSLDDNCRKCEVNLLSTYRQGIKTNCTCSIPFRIKKWEGNVCFYYGLTNFFQNHARYVHSKDDSQLYGVLSSKTSFIASHLITLMERQLPRVVQ